jgi:hypothetical protein
MPVYQPRAARANIRAITSMPSVNPAAYSGARPTISVPRSPMASRTVCRQSTMVIFSSAYVTLDNLLPPARVFVQILDSHTKETYHQSNGGSASTQD